MRTTLDIDAPILRALKRLLRRGGKSLGRQVSDLHAQSVAAQRAVPDVPLPFNWTSRAMGSCIHLCHKDALLDALDQPLR